MTYNTYLGTPDTFGAQGLLGPCICGKIHTAEWFLLQILWISTWWPFTVHIKFRSVHLNYSVLPAYFDRTTLIISHRVQLTFFPIATEQENTDQIAKVMCKSCMIHYVTVIQWHTLYLKPSMQLLLAPKATWSPGQKQIQKGVQLMIKRNSHTWSMRNKTKRTSYECTKNVYNETCRRFVDWKMIFFFHILGISSSPLTLMFFGGIETTNQMHNGMSAWLNRYKLPAKERKKNTSI